MKLFRLLSIIAVLAIIVSACSTHKAPETNTFQPEKAAGKFTNNMDEALLAMEQKVPGFGGMFFDKDGNLNVVMKSGGLPVSATDLASKKSSVATAVRAVMGDKYLSRVSRGSVDLGEDSLNAPVASKEAEIKFVAGTYTVSQLLGWKRSAGNIFGVKGVVYLDMDEMANRVRIGVEKGTSRTAIQAALTKQGIPSGAVVVSETSAIKPLATLQDRLRPSRAGAQINWDNDNNFGNGSWVCTLGFNATWYGYGVFLTNSHCSGLQGGTQYINYYQNSYYGSNTYIGYEWYDPTYFSGGYCVYTGYVCRWSDSAIGYYTITNWTMGRVWRTTSYNGSLTLAVNPTTGKYKVFNIVAEWTYPSVGYAMEKVGRTTGWTYGVVTQTCVDTGVNGTNIVQLCQDFVKRSGANIVAGGDSGSPAFYWYGGNQIALSGLLWGGGSSDGVYNDTFVFSPMGNIEYELGALTTPY